MAVAALGPCLELAISTAAGSPAGIVSAQQVLADGIAACAAASTACIEASMRQAVGTGLATEAAVLDAASACELQPAFDARTLMVAPEASQVVMWAWRTWAVVGWYHIVQFVVMPWVFLWTFSGTILGLIRFCNVQYQLFRLVINFLTLMGLFIIVTIEETVLNVLKAVYAQCNRMAGRQYGHEAALEASTTFEDYSRAQLNLLEFEAMQGTCRGCSRGRPRAVTDHNDDHVKWLVHTLDQPRQDLSTLEPLLVREPGGIEWENLQQSDKLLEQLSANLRSVCAKLSKDAASRVELLQWLKARQKTLGVTALCLSGGGSLAMYHMGVCRFLLEEGLLPEVVSGVSGGSIIAGFMAMHTDDELLHHVFRNDIVVRHEGKRWFPPWWRQMMTFMRSGNLVPTEEFEATTNAYYGTWTFEEAFARTGREVSIVVSSVFSSQLPGCIMLNHMTAPRVTIASAVASSCAAMGIMKPRGLFMKDAATGQLRPFDVLGKSFQDGTVSVEFPKDYLRSFYGATQFLVSQVNPHVHSFMGQKTSTFQTLRSYFGNDLQKRARLLSQYRLLPAFFGRNISQVTKHLSQEFTVSKSGLTILSPDMGLSSVKAAVSNPSVEDMNNYLLGGQRMAWKKAQQTRALMRTETTLAELIHGLEPRGEVWATTDQPPLLPSGDAVKRSFSSATMSTMSPERSPQSQW